MHLHQAKGEYKTRRRGRTGAGEATIQRDLSSLFKDECEVLHLE